MSSAIETLDLIRSGLLAGVMTYSVYDSANRLIEYYEAATDIEHGEPCLKSEYKYVGSTNIVLATRETVAQWDSAWDFDTL